MDRGHLGLDLRNPFPQPRPFQAIPPRAPQTSPHPKRTLQTTNNAKKSENRKSEGVDLEFFRNCRRFGTKCAGCGEVVLKNDRIRRARDKVRLIHPLAQAPSEGSMGSSQVFHVHCFCCNACGKPLETGEELYILNGAKFICKADYLASRCTCIPSFPVRPGVANVNPPT